MFLSTVSISYFILMGCTLYTVYEALDIRTNNIPPVHVDRTIMIISQLNIVIVIAVQLPNSSTCMITCNLLFQKKTRYKHFYYTACIYSTSTIVSFPTCNILTVELEYKDFSMCILLSNVIMYLLAVAMK